LGYSIWLTFCENSELKLQCEIERLAKKYSGPIFQPHLTLIGDLDLDVKGARQVADIFAATQLPSEISVCHVGISKMYFMALHLSVEIPTELQSMRQYLAQSVNPKSYKLDEPHISLAYGDLDVGTLEIERRSLTSAFHNKKLSVQGLSIVQSSKSVPVLEWKCIKKIDLKVPK
jgi:2'-5' RNA ligase